MQIAMVVPWFDQARWGGTEAHVHALSQTLCEIGAEVVVYAPTAKLGRFTSIGFHVKGFRTQTELAQELTQFDLVHQHGLATAIGLEPLVAAHRQNVATVFTMHLPDLVCVRGTMMLFGTSPCDGKVFDRCRACWLQSKGVPKGLASTVSWLPDTLRLIGRGRSRTVLDTRRLVRQKTQSLRSLRSGTSHLIAPASWAREALIVNGFSRERVTHVPHAVLPGSVASEPCGYLRIGFLGRSVAVKGIDALLAALAQAKARNLQLVHAGGPPLTNVPKHVDYRPLGPLPPDELDTFWHSIDVLAVPSQWLEIGPLVALEALARSIPLLGSNVGGIAEIVEDGVSGWLLPFNDVTEWTVQIDAIASDMDQLLTKRRWLGDAKRRTVGEMTRDTMAVYRKAMAIRE